MPPGWILPADLHILLRTCFFVLGLISSTPQGAEILDDYHWEATLSPLGLPSGLCVPTNIDNFVSVRIVAFTNCNIAERWTAAPFMDSCGELRRNWRPARGAGLRGRNRGHDRYLQPREHSHCQHCFQNVSQVGLKSMVMRSKL